MELAHPVDVGACRPQRGTGGHSAARWGVHASPWRLQEPLCTRDGLLCLPPTLNSATARDSWSRSLLTPPRVGIVHVVPTPKGVALCLSGPFEDGPPHIRQGWVAGRTGNTLHDFKSKSHNWALTGWCRINSRCVRPEGQQLSSAWEDGIVRVGPDLACAGRGSWGYLGPSGWTGGSSSDPGGHGPVGGSVRSGARCLPSHPLLVDLAQDPPSCPPLSALSLLRTTPPSAPPGSPWNSPPHTLRETSKDA